MTQEPLFHDSVYDALKSIVRYAGGPKTVGPMIWPAKGEAASNWLSDCLNPARKEKLDLEELLMLLKIGRDAGFHGAKHWIDGELGYAPTPPVEPDDQVTELARVITGASEQLRRATEALERVQGRKAARR